MQHFSYYLQGTQLDELKKWITTPAVLSALTKAPTVVVQLMTEFAPPDFIHELSACIKEHIPHSLVTALASQGGIHCSKIHEKGVTVSFMAFEKATAQGFLLDNTSQPEKDGQALRKTLDALPDIRGLFICGTALTMNMALLFKGLHGEKALPCPVFGGAAWVFSEGIEHSAYVSLDGEHTHAGCILIAFCGPELTITPFYHQGYFSLTKRMTITGAENTSTADHGSSHILHTIDGEPAFDVVNRYYGLNPEEEINAHHSHEFPLLIHRANRIVPRAIGQVIENNSVTMLSDVFEGDALTIGYSNPYLLSTGFDKTLEKIKQLDPDTLFVIGCIGRRIVLRDEVIQEVAPLEEIGTNAGFFAGGEYYGFDDKIEILNASHVIICFREALHNKQLPQATQTVLPVVSPQNADSYTATMFRLLNFIDNAAKEQEKTWNQLRDMETQMLETEKQATLGRLVAGVAHEVNTPLGLALSYVTYLQDKLGTLLENYRQGAFKKSTFEAFCDSLEESLGYAEQNLNRAADLVKSFKQVAVDQTSEQRRTIEVHAYMESSLASLQSKWRGSPYTVTLQGEEQEIQMHSYPGALMQVISNLIDNSLIHGFRDKQTGEITITLSREDENTLLLEHRDTGNGMDEQTQKRIFDPFYTTNRHGGGTGLGMHIIYNIVTQTLQGQIRCTSTPGKGTTFTLLLPLAPEEQQADPSAQHQST